MFNSFKPSSSSLSSASSRNTLSTSQPQKLNTQSGKTFSSGFCPGGGNPVPVPGGIICLPDLRPKPSTQTPKPGK